MTTVLDSIYERRRVGSPTKDYSLYRIREEFDATWSDQ